MPKDKPSANKESIRDLVSKNLQKQDQSLKSNKADKKDAQLIEADKQRRFHIFPKFMRNTFGEIKLVTWPDRKSTIKLTFAVIVFSVVFSVFVGAFDWVFEIVFKKVFLHG